MAVAGKSVLIVEDDISLRKALASALENEGINVMEAGDGASAINAALNYHPDLVLLDLIMPTMDGVEMLEELRKDIWGAKARVIVLTNLDEDDTVINEMVKARPTYYLVKAENSLNEVVAKVKEVLAVDAQGSEENS